MTGTSEDSSVIHRDFHRDKLQEWFRLYGDEVYRYLMYVAGTTDVDDLVQDTFIRAFAAMSSYQERGAPKAWLLAIARHRFLDAVRQQTRQSRLSGMRLEGLDVTREVQTIASPEKQPDEVVVDREALHQVLKLLHTIHPQYREVLILRGIHDLPPEEAARVLQCSVNSVNVTYHRALKMARKLLETPGEGM